jgi:hypothetical protein
MMIFAFILIVMYIFMILILAGKSSTLYTIGTDLCLAEGKNFFEKQFLSSLYFYFYLITLLLLDL